MTKRIDQSNLYGGKVQTVPKIKRRTTSRSQGLPLQLASDDDAWQAAVTAIVEAGFAPRRPSPTQLKVGPYNYYPSTRRMTQDPCVSFERRGIQSFLALLQNSTAHLPRLGQLAINGLASDRLHVAIAPPPPQPCPISQEQRLPQPAPTHRKNLFAKSCTQLTADKPEFHGPFDLCLSTMEANLAGLVCQLAAAQCIGSETRGLEPFVSSRDLVHFLASHDDEISV